MKINNPSNVFVLTTGRSGSATFTEACSHINNYTAAHESRCSMLGDQRLAYPSNHIEVDNRLAWFLGRLEKKYGDKAVYVHLTRNPMLVAESYNKRWTFYGSIAMSYTRGVLKSKLFGLEPCADYVQTATENIEAFLATKSSVFTIDIQDPEAGFKEFWSAIDAKGNLDKALREFDRRHNPSASYEKEPAPPSFESENDKTIYEMQQVLRMFEQEKSTLLGERSLQYKENKNLGKKLKTIQGELDGSRSQLKTIQGELDGSRSELNQVKQQARENREKIVYLQHQLAYRVGNAIVNNIKSPIGWVKMPFVVVRACINYKKENSKVITDLSNRKKMPSNTHNKMTKGAAVSIEDASQKVVPTNLIWEASQLVSSKGYQEALKFIADKGSQRDKLTAHLLKASQDLDNDNKWMKHVNLYLKQYDIAQIKLTPGTSTRFHRITADTPYTISDGPLVTIIMPAFNAERFLEHSVTSILNQTWKNIELIIVDDASEDNTWSIMQLLAARDNRIKLLRNDNNSGPYVAKNFALNMANGIYVTGHDADDWAHPQRIEKHVAAMLAHPDLKASYTYMLRATPQCEFTLFTKPGRMSPDGALRIASISCFYDLAVFREKLGYWDSVRFAADTELMERAIKVFGDQFAAFNQFGMFCLDAEGGLTNHPKHGIYGPAGLSPVRREYRAAWMGWHKTLDEYNAHLNFPQDTRKFDAPKAMLIKTRK